VFPDVDEKAVLVKSRLAVAAPFGRNLEKGMFANEAMLTTKGINIINRFLPSNPYLNGPTNNAITRSMSQSEHYVKALFYALQLEVIQPDPQPSLGQNPDKRR
jgi:hypothetical protein